MTILVNGKSILKAHEIPKRGADPTAAARTLLSKGDHLFARDRITAGLGKPHSRCRPVKQRRKTGAVLASGYAVIVYVNASVSLLQRAALLIRLRLNCRFGAFFGARRVCQRRNTRKKS